MLSCLQQPPFNNKHLSTILLETQLFLPSISNHLTITSISLTYFQRHNYSNRPTASTTQYYPPAYHTTRDTTVLTCLQQPPYKNNYLSTILSATQVYLPAYINRLTITTTCLPYYKTPPCSPAYSNRLTITSTCIPYYQRYDCTYLPTETTFTNVTSLPFKRKFYYSLTVK